MSKVRWGLLSTASIGRVVVAACRRARAAEFVAVASRGPERAQRFADEFGLEASFGSYDELLAADDVDAVYVALPNSMHAEWVQNALEAGKHVLCEKPFAPTAEETITCFDAAKAAGRVCVEGFMYRHHPQTTKFRELLADGAIGELTFVRSALSTRTEPSDIRRSTEMAGGSLADLGAYCASATRLVAGEPLQVFAEQVLDGPQGVDLRFAATIRLENGVVAQFDTGLDLPRRDELELIGTTGRIVVPDPWLCRSGYVELVRDSETSRIPVDPDGTFALTEADHDVYRIEFDAVSTAILTGSPPVFDATDAVRQARLIDALRASAQDGSPVSLPALQ
ncbi:MAG TPA: Gfo/Idh/MocA family oxidoreductase [Nocardioidaceae bacterium]|jgi:predicted dehydrogenase